MPIALLLPRLPGKSQPWVFCLCSWKRPPNQWEWPHFKFMVYNLLQALRYHPSIYFSLSLIGSGSHSCYSKLSPCSLLTSHFHSHRDKWGPLSINESKTSFPNIQPWRTRFSSCLALECSWEASLTLFYPRPLVTCSLVRLAVSHIICFSITEFTMLN